MKKTELFEEGAEVSGSLAKKTAKAVVVSGIAVFMAFIILASSFLSIPGLLISDLGDYVDKKFTEWKVNKSVTAIVNSFEDIENNVSKEIIDEIQDGYIPTWKKDVKNYWKDEKVTDFGINNDDIYGTKDLVGWKLYSENQTAAYTGARFENYYRVSGQSDKLDSIYFMCAYAVWHQSHNTSSDKKDVKDLSQEDLDKRWQNFDISGLKTFIKDNKYKILRVNFTYSNDTVHRKVSNGDVTQDFDVPMRTLSFDLKVATNDEIASIFNLSEDEQEVAQTYANMSTALFESVEEGSSKATKLSFDPISAVLQKVYGVEGESTTEIFANAKKQDKFQYEFKHDKNTGSKKRSAKGKVTKKGSRFNGDVNSIAVSIAIGDSGESAGGDLNIEIDSSMQGSGTLGWPTPPNHRHITSHYGPRKHPTLGVRKPHEGIDIECPRNTNIRAAKDGTVSRSKFDAGGYGWYVMINHGGGLQTLYAHNTRIIVKYGQKVKKGQVIAKSGSTGRSTGPHCHFGVAVNGEFKDPEKYLSIK